MADAKRQIASMLMGEQPQQRWSLADLGRYYPVPEPTKAYTSWVLPLSRDAFGSVSFDSDAGLMGLGKRVAQGALSSAWSGVTAPGDAYAGRLPMMDGSGNTSLEAIGRSAELAGLMTLGATGAPRGALGSGAVLPKRLPLPMDEASRLARAKEMGFYTEMPLYHGTGATFDSFKSVPTNAGGMATPGVSLSRSPGIANEYAVRSPGNGQANPQVHKLFHRAEKPAALTLTGKETHSEVVATLRDAFDNGYDAVMLRNYTSPNGEKGDIIIVRDGNQLRSPAAKFDPAKKASSDLLASLGPSQSLG